MGSPQCLSCCSQPYPVKPIRSCGAGVADQTPELSPGLAEPYDPICSVPDHLYHLRSLEYLFCEIRCVIPCESSCAAGVTSPQVCIDASS